MGISGCHQKSKNQSHIWDFGVIVRRSHWGRGVATRLMARVLEETEKAGAMKVRLDVAVCNERAVRIYRERFGFEVEGLLKNEYAAIDGTYLDNYAMAKFFKAA